ncbi:hypothetical protein [Amylolactobacillus amylophilus]|uniref:hypothetical protein n=1 Tax=Amylolactobacillus amylophilus TaxID=1603 RepID=UPI0006D21B62|nr:hypothetical protein [Amylolactobacillus amylophilus]
MKQTNKEQEEVSLEPPTLNNKKGFHDDFLDNYYAEYSRCYIIKGNVVPKKNVQTGGNMTKLQQPNQLRKKDRTTGLSNLNISSADQV